MSLRPAEIAPVPAATAQVAAAAFPKGCAAMRMRDELGTVYDDRMFASLYPVRSQPAHSPWRLALVTVLQFTEGLSDRQAADAVRGRIDWKYALGLELTDPGFDFSVLCEFRARLIAGRLEQGLLDPAHDQAGAELAQNGEVKPGVGELQAQRILPVDPPPDRVGRLPVAQPLGELQHRDQGQAPRGVRRLAANRVEGGEHPVVVDRTQLVAQAHGRTALWERGRRDLDGRGGNRRNLGRTQRHGNGSAQLTRNRLSTQNRRFCQQYQLLLRSQRPLTLPSRFTPKVVSNIC